MPQKKVEDFETLLEINRAIFSTLDSREILYLIVKKISEIIEVTRCSIIYINKEMNTGQILSTYEDPALDTFTIDIRKYPEIVRAIEDEKMIIVQDAGVDPVIREVKDILLNIGIKSIMVIPIRYSEGDIGVLYLRTSRKRNKFNDKEIKICQIISGMAAIALRNAQLFHIIKQDRALLEKMAVTDDLTGLYNHRFFVKRLNEEYKRASRYNNPLSFLMIDIDNFKKINDAHGHQKGNVILKEVSKVIKSSVREIDVVARYGGEEFAVILPHTGIVDAFNLANRIRNAIKCYRSDILGEKVSITVSIGVSTYPDSKVKGVDDLIRRADDGLYKAKSQGKDTVISV